MLRRDGSHLYGSPLGLPCPCSQHRSRSVLYQNERVVSSVKWNLNKKSLHARGCGSYAHYLVRVTRQFGGSRLVRESKVCDSEMCQQKGANNGMHTLDLRDEWYSTRPTQKCLECATLGNTVVGRMVLGIQPNSRNLG